ncbi:hypothetical protein RGQ29_000372 [Quercus rubra]|uniref:Myb/SANT-like domain-containing protein n=1 Tax=Quercus rubra TaxID=3512 RepID=A0AAN7JCS8_QUERU|nr:hypothetical protein RGQ29_000372 [Quercus rubra]
MAKNTTSNSKAKKMIEAGNRKKKCASFSPEGWNNLVSKFYNIIGKNYNKDQLKNSVEKLKGHDIDLGWDAVKGTIDASDDWWDMKLKEVPKTSKFQEKGLKNLQQLDRVFRDVAVIGVIAWTSSSNTLPPTMPQEGQTSESVSSSQEKKKKIGGAAKLDDHLSQLINLCENRSLAISQELPSSISNVMEIVRTLPRVKEYPNFFIQSSYVLMKRSRREMFLMFKELESQLQWLQGMLLKQNK